MTTFCYRLKPKLKLELQFQALEKTLNLRWFQDVGVISKRCTIPHVQISTSDELGKFISSVTAKNPPSLIKSKFKSQRNSNF